MEINYVMTDLENVLTIVQTIRKYINRMGKNFILHCCTLIVYVMKLKKKIYYLPKDEEKLDSCMAPYLVEGHKYITSSHMTNVNVN